MSLTIFKGQEKQDIPVNNVYAKVEFNDRTYYKKPSILDDFFPWEWVELEADGLIRIYNKEKNIQGTPNGTSMMTPGFVQLHLFVEKDNAYHYLFVTGSLKQNKKKTQEILTGLLADDSECLTIISNPDFTYSRENIVAVIRKYNQNKFSRKGSNVSTDSTNVIFYQTTAPYDARIFIEGHEFKIDSDSKIVVRLPKKTLYQVCVDNPSTNCEIINTDVFTKYFSIVKDKDGNRSIKPGNLKNASLMIRNFTDL